MQDMLLQPETGREAQHNLNHDGVAIALKNKAMSSLITYGNSKLTGEVARDQFQ